MDGKRRSRGQRPASPRATGAPEAGAGGAKRRVGRRRLVKGAVATAAGVAAAGYVKPSLDRLEIPVAHAFTF